MPRKPAFISHSVEREAEIQSRMLDVLEASFRRRIQSAIIAESDEILSGYRELGYVPPASDMAVMRFQVVYRALALASARTFGARIITAGKAAGHQIETKQEEGGFAAFFRALANAWINLEPIRRRITSVTETTRNQIVTQVAKGQEEGLGVDAIAKRITERLPDISRQRGALIARTEVHGAANYSMHETAKSTGLDLVKEWVATEDRRTRSIARDDAFDHLAMDGQVRDMDEPFDMPWIGGGGEPLKIMYPGEAGKPGGAVISCRCVTVHDVKSPDGEEDEPSQIDLPPVGFAYERFNGVKTAKEAEDYLIANGIAEVASLRAISVKNLGPSIKAAHEVKERFNLEPLKFFGPTSRDKRARYKKVKNANAAVFPGMRAMHIPTKFGDMSDPEKQIKLKKDRAALYELERQGAISANQNISDDVKERVKKMPAGEYTWSITQSTPQSERAKTIYHEFGHVLHKIDTTAKPLIDDFLQQAQPNKNGWSLLLSRYAGSNDAEYVAEAFAVYMTRDESEHYRIHPQLLSIFTKLDRKND